MEFTDILESVQVELHSNPWTDLPQRWGKLWPGTHATDAAAGYNLSDAVDYLYGMRAFYDTAEQVWEELGVFHYTQKLCFEDFLQELRVRMPKTWHEGLVEYVKHVYFAVSKMHGSVLRLLFLIENIILCVKQSRQTGIFTRFYALDEATAQENARRLAADKRKREQQVVNSRRDLARRQKHLLEVYGDDAQRRARHATERATEHERNDEVKQRVAFNNVRAKAIEDEQLSIERQERREKAFEKLRVRELGRLEEILDADNEGREEEKLIEKKKRRLPYKLSQLNLYA